MSHRVTRTRLLRLVVTLIASLMLLSGGLVASAAPAGERVVTDYQDPVQPLPPVSRPPTKSCTVTAMHHEFANSYDKPYAGTLAPPPGCTGPWTKVVLDWTSTSQGRQYDRMAGLWIGGAEVLRTSTPEPDPSGIMWHFDRDITAFAPLLNKPQPFVVDLGNIVNDVYTGAYDTTVRVTYYQADEAHPPPKQADVVVPLAADPNRPGWQWPAPGQSYRSKVTVPQNTRKLTADVYARGGGCEEFWWSNVPGEVAGIDLSLGLCGGATYREVTVKVDGRPAGVVAPHPTIYTGGVAPSLWRPVSAIDAIVTQPHTIDLTPFAGTLTDGRPHDVEIVPPKGAVDKWTMGGNLFATTDPGVQRVTGEVREAQVPGPDVQQRTSGAGLDETTNVDARRGWRTSGVLHTSRGDEVAESAGSWNFHNSTELSQHAARWKTSQNVAGEYTSKISGAEPESRRDQFGFPLEADQTMLHHPGGFRVDGKLHIGRKLRTDAGTTQPAATVGYSEDTMDTAGVFGRTNEVVDASDSNLSASWRGLDGAGNCYDHQIIAEHEWITRDLVNTRHCGGVWR